MRRAGEDLGGRFPLVAGLVCTVAAALLLWKGVLPAKSEHQALTQLEDARKQELRGLWLQNRALGERQAALEWDPEAVLLEIDRLGLTPEELLASTEKR